MTAPALDVPLQPPVRHNLPASLTSYIGRKKEREDLSRLLRSDSTRLVTITGADGMGKTRLALQVAVEVLPAFTHGAWLVDLSALDDPGLVAQSVVNALGWHGEADIPYEELIARVLQPKNLLLLLDNCEHLVNACARLATALLKSCPYLRILATSREALGVEGEALYPLATLAFPDPTHLPSLDELRQYEAVQLFGERAALVYPGFEVNQDNALSMAQLCQRLDGLPLALELAAARTNLLSLPQMVDRLDARLWMLIASTRTPLARHRSLQACLDWSYALLSEKERILLRRLAVFTGGWTLEATEAVCSDPPGGPVSGIVLEQAAILDLLSQLVSKSLVTAALVTEARQQPEMRYRLLDTIRQYARERLVEAGEELTLRDRHLAYFLDLANLTALKPFGNRWPRQWKLLKHDVENLRTALGWALTDDLSPRIEDGLRLVGMLHDFWLQSCMYREGFDWSAKALALTDGLEPRLDSLRALALEVNGVTRSILWYPQEGKLPLEESVELFRKCGDEWRLVRVLADLRVFSYGASSDRARVAIEESVTLARKVGDQIFLAASLLWKGDLERKQGNLVAAIRDCQESLKLLLEIEERGGACYPLVVLGSSAMQRGDFTTGL